MEFSKPKRHMMDLLFTLGLFGIFAIMSLMIVMIGANVYQSTTARMDNNYMTRTSLSYITEKVHQYDQAGSIQMTEIEGEPALAMESTIKGTSYTSYIYFYNGNICELFTKTEKTPTCKRGTPVVEAKSLQIEELEGQCFRITVTDERGRTAETFARPISDQAE